MPILNTAFDKLVHFFYPAYCLHCDGGVKKGKDLLCPTCFNQIEWIDRKERCPRCHGPQRCNCKAFLHPHRSLFENQGPITALYKEFVQTKRGKTLASLIMIALSKTTWPFPEVVVPLTEGPFPKLEKSYHLAKELANLLKVPLSLPSPSIQDKQILLLAPSLSNTESLLEGKRTLAKFFPFKIYTIALIDHRDLKRV